MGQGVSYWASMKLVGIAERKRMMGLWDKVYCVMDIATAVGVITQPQFFSNFRKLFDSGQIVCYHYYDRHTTTIVVR